MKPVLALIIVCMLGGCRTGIYEDTVGPGEYWINATAPGGVYGGAFGIKPEPDVLPREASRVCPNGYQKLSETRSGADGGVIRWHIRCDGAAGETRPAS